MRIETSMTVFYPRSTGNERTYYMTIVYLSDDQ